MLADCHIHMVLDGSDWRAALARHAHGPDIPWIRAQLQIYRDKGFTYLRDGGDRWGAGLCARELACEYGITYRTPLSPLCRQGHYGSFIGLTYNNLREYSDLVSGIRRDGGDFIKIMISGLMNFNCFGELTEDPLPDDDIHALVDIAHNQGMAVMAHANGARAVTAAALAGVDSVEHGAYLDHEALQAMAENGTVWVPTLSTLGNPLGKGRFSDPDLQKILNSALENIRSFAAMGGILAPGTDAGAWAVPHGSTTEYALLSRAGISKELLLRGIRVIQEKFQTDYRRYDL